LYKLAARVMPLRPDVTSDAQIRATAQEIGSLDSLINNEGVALYDDLTDRAALEQGPWLRWKKGRLSQCLIRMQSRGPDSPRALPHGPARRRCGHHRQGRALIEKAAPLHLADVRNVLIDLPRPHNSTC